MGIIIYNVFAFIGELVMAFWHYSNGKYTWAMIFSGLAGLFFAEIIHRIKEELE
jgi:hypothetical protein